MNVELTGFLVVIALLCFEGAQPEEVSWTRTQCIYADQSDMLHSQADFTLVAFFVHIAQQRMSQTQGIGCRR